MARYSQLSSNSSGGIQELIPAVVIPEVIATSARQEVFMPLVRRLDLTGPGDDFNVPNAGALTWSTYTSGNSPDEQAFNTSQRTITPTLRQLDVVIPIDALQGSIVNVQDEIVKEAGLGLALSHDAGFAALYTEAIASNPDHLGIGTDGTAMSFLSLRTGMGLLYAQNAPKRFAWVLHPDQWAGELLLDDTMINAAVKGAAVLTQGMGANGFITSVLDVDIYVCDQIIESSGRHSIMLSKNAAFGYGFKRLTHPVTGASQEILMDTDWNSARRSLEINMTYHADFEGLKGSSTTTNNWIVDLIS